MFGAVEFGSTRFGAVRATTTTPHVPFIAQYALEVDWDNNGTFTDTYDNVSDRTFSVDYLYGRDYASQLIGRSVAGRLRADLLNSDGRYSSLNASSPLTGKLLPRRKVRLRSVTADQVLFTGFLDGPPKPTVKQGSLARASLSASGPFALLANSNLRISLPLQQNQRSGVIIGLILDAAGWPAANRIIDTGDVLIGNWAIEDKGVMEALQEIEEAEGGFLREGTNWDIVFESRYARLLNARSISSQATFSDSAVAVLPYKEIDQDDPLRQIYNRVEVPVQYYTLDAADSVLWQSVEIISLSPGETRVITAKYGSGIAFARTIPFLQLITTVTPSSLTASLSTALTPNAKSARISLTNTHGSSSMQVAVSLSGKAYRESTKYSVRREDAASQALYNLRTYPFASPWFANLAYAESTADWVIATYKDPHPVLGVGFPLKPDLLWMQSIQRVISDRITLTANGTQVPLGINQDFFIESISLSLRTKQIPRYSMALSPAPAPTAWGRFDVHKFNTDFLLAY
jgi:hypothetical protein